MDLNEAWGISKENIQSLKQGRKHLQLGTALQAQANIEVQQYLVLQRDDFETRLRLYEGDDLLKVWYDYIQWTEQNFPKQQHDLKKSLEEFFLKFINEKKYAQDECYVQLWMKYIYMSTEPLQYYELMYDKEIGTTYAIFYCKWADQLDKNGDITQADKVYIKGLERSAQPIDALLLAYNHFQLSVARRVLSAGCTSLPPDPSTVRPHGRKRAAIDSSIQRPAPGVLRPLDNNAAFGEKKKVQKPNVAAKIYNDENTNMDAVGQYYEFNPATKVPVREQITKEKAKERGRWNEGTFKQDLEQYPSSQPAFEIYQDKCDGQQPRQLDKHISCEVALFESPNPCRRPMYDKHKVYAVAGTEFSLEELRAMKYNKRYEEQKAKENKAKHALEAEILLPDVSKETAQSVISVHRSVGTCSSQPREEEFEESQPLHNDGSTQEILTSNDSSSRAPPFALYVDELSKRTVPASKPEKQWKLEVPMLQQCTYPLADAWQIRLKTPKKVHRVSELSMVEDEDVGVHCLDRCTMSNETCNSQTFKYPLPSSTPRVNKFRHIPPWDEEESGEDKWTDIRNEMLPWHH